MASQDESPTFVPLNETESNAFMSYFGHVAILMRVLPRLREFALDGLDKQMPGHLPEEHRLGIKRAYLKLWFEANRGWSDFERTIRSVLDLHELSREQDSTEVEQTMGRDGRRFMFNCIWLMRRLFYKWKKLADKIAEKSASTKLQFSVVVKQMIDFNELENNTFSFFGSEYEWKEELEDSYDYSMVVRESDGIGWKESVLDEFQEVLEPAGGEDIELMLSPIQVFEVWQRSDLPLTLFETARAGLVKCTLSTFFINIHTMVLGIFCRSNVPGMLLLGMSDEQGFLAGLSGEVSEFYRDERKMRHPRLQRVSDVEDSSEGRRSGSDENKGDGGRSGSE